MRSGRIGEHTREETIAVGGRRARAVISGELEEVEEVEESV